MYARTTMGVLWGILFLSVSSVEALGLPYMPPSYTHEAHRPRSTPGQTMGIIFSMDRNLGRLLIQDTTGMITEFVIVSLTPKHTRTNPDGLIDLSRGDQVTVFHNVNSRLVNRIERR